MNSWGNLFRLTSFGESHGPAIGGVIDGCPAGIELDTAFIQQELNRAWQQIAALQKRLDELEAQQKRQKKEKE